MSETSAKKFRPVKGTRLDSDSHYVLHNRDFGRGRCRSRQFELRCDRVRFYDADDTFSEVKGHLCPSSL